LFMLILSFLKLSKHRIFLSSLYSVSYRNVHKAKGWLYQHTNIQIYKSGNTFIPTLQWKWGYEISHDMVPGFKNQNKFR
jgi:hypothetical protein